MITGSSHNKAKPLAIMAQIIDIRRFAKHYPWAAPVLWIASTQFFGVMAITALAWTKPYSLSANTISDLGNNLCGPYSGRYVCSPLHAWMNASLVILGLTMLAGAILFYYQLYKTRLKSLGFIFMAVAGIGTVLVGLFNENSAGGLHTLGAGLPFLIGNSGLLLLGLSLDLPRLLRLYTLLSGLIPLIALSLFVNQKYLGLGIGGLERLIAHPQTIWLIVFGIYSLRANSKNF